MKLYKNLKSALLQLSVLTILFAFALLSINAQGGKDGSNGGDSQNNGKGQGNGNGDVVGDGDSSSSDMQKVLQLFKQNRFSEAVPYLAVSSPASVHKAFGRPL